MLNKFADELKSIRISKNLSLQQVAVKTRIDQKFLEFMERGDFEFLPELYVKSFLKEYLRILGLDEQLYMKKFINAKTGADVVESASDTEPVSPKLENVPAEPVSPAAPSPSANLSQFDAVNNYRRREEESRNARIKKKRLYYLTMAVVIAVGILYYFLFRDNNEIVVPEKSWEEIVEDTKERYNEDDSSVNAVTENSNVSNTDSLSLTVRAIDTTWIRIVLDNIKTEEFILFPGSQKSMKARNDYKIIIGNSGGVKLDLNGKPVNFKFQSGSVQRIQIDSNGVKAIEQETAG